jgi:CBS domain-containing protein
MAQNIRDVMTPNPTAMPAMATVSDAARAMRDADIGAIVVLNQDQICGIVTDRDIVVRAIAEGREPASTSLADICSQDLTILSPSDTVEDAMRLMGDRAIRRIPVVEDGRPVGIVSLGDLAVEGGDGSALEDISAAPPNR